MIEKITVLKCPYCNKIKQYPDDFFQHQKNMTNGSMQKIGHRCTDCIEKKRKIIDSDPFYQKYEKRAISVISGVNNRAKKKNLPNEIDRNF